MTAKPSLKNYSAAAFVSDIEGSKAFYTEVLERAARKAAR
jgi:hypothetical protein